MVRSTQRASVLSLREADDGEELDAADEEDSGQIDDASKYVPIGSASTVEIVTAVGTVDNIESHVSAVAEPEQDEEEMEAVALDTSGVESKEDDRVDGNITAEYDAAVYSSSENNIDENTDHSTRLETVRQLLDEAIGRAVVQGRRQEEEIVDAAQFGEASETVVMGQLASSVDASGADNMDETADDETTMPEVVVAEEDFTAPSAEEEKMTPEAENGGDLDDTNVELPADPTSAASDDPTSGASDDPTSLDTPSTNGIIYEAAADESAPDAVEDDRSGTDADAAAAAALEEESAELELELSDPIGDIEDDAACNEKASKDFDGPGTAMEETTLSSLEWVTSQADGALEEESLATPYKETAETETSPNAGNASDLTDEISEIGSAEEQRPSTPAPEVQADANTEETSANDNDQADEIALSVGNKSSSPDGLQSPPPAHLVCRHQVSQLATQLVLAPEDKRESDGESNHEDSLQFFPDDISEADTEILDGEDVDQDGEEKTEDRTAFFDSILGGVSGDGSSSTPIELRKRRRVSAVEDSLNKRMRSTSTEAQPPKRNSSVQRLYKEISDALPINPVSDDTNTGTGKDTVNTIDDSGFADVSQNEPSAPEEEPTVDHAQAARRKVPIGR